jgi:pyrroline-5-carboxylate reductase
VKIAIIGCGNLGTSLARGLLRSKEHDLRLRLCDRTPAKTDGLLGEFLGAEIYTTLDPREAVKGADVVVIAVKPKDMDETLEHIRAALGADTLLVSCASGIEVSYIEEALGRKIAVARAMPNTAVSVAAGTTGLFLGQHCDVKRDEARLNRVFAILSDCRVVESEDVLHAVTALSGSGPAFVLLMLEAMVEAAVRAGLPRKEAIFFANGAFKAAHALVAHGDFSPSELREHITSPAGTTADGLYRLEKAGFRGIVMDAIDETILRSVDLGLMSMGR